VRIHRQFLNKDKQSHGDAPDTIDLKSCIVVCRVRRHRQFLNKDKQSHGDAPDTIDLKFYYTIIVGRSETEGCFLKYCHLVGASP
jgi:hypothetical protein